MTEKPRIEQVILVEGKYDAAKLADLVDALILPVGGFAVFTRDETKALIRRLGAQRGLIILTDSDAAGFRIRAYLNKLAQGLPVQNAYVPAIAGKERRKASPSKEGLLGVEGVPAREILRALETAGATMRPRRQGRELTYADLYELGISGTPDSAERRRALLTRLGLPPRLSKKAILEVFNSLYSYEELAAAVNGAITPSRESRP